MEGAPQRRRGVVLSGGLELCGQLAAAERKATLSKQERPGGERESRASLLTGRVLVTGLDDAAAEFEGALGVPSLALGVRPEARSSD